MEIIKDAIEISRVKALAAATFGNMVKAVVDIKNKHIAIDGELHSDLEALLLEKGAKQEDLWGINLYPDIAGDGFIEFDSMINMRPSQGNMSRGVSSEIIRNKIIEIVTTIIKQ